MHINVLFTSSKTIENKPYSMHKCEKDLIFSRKRRAIMQAISYYYKQFPIYLSVTT